MNRMENRQDWFDQILGNMEEAVHVLDCDGITVYYNRAASEMDGLNPCEVVGKHVFAGLSVPDAGNKQPAAGSVNRKDDFEPTADDCEPYRQNCDHFIFNVSSFSKRRAGRCV